MSANSVEHFLIAWKVACSEGRADGVGADNNWRGYGCWFVLRYNYWLHHGLGFD